MGTRGREAVSNHARPLFERKCAKFLRCRGRKAETDTAAQVWTFGPPCTVRRSCRITPQDTGAVQKGIACPPGPRRDRAEAHSPTGC